MEESDERKSELTENDDIRIILPNKALRDFVREALPCGEFEVVCKVVPNREEVEALVLVVDRWAKECQKVRVSPTTEHMRNGY
jgi:hypothetical protein